MNSATRRHLELDTRIDGEQKHTLLGVLDSTVTPMGGRLLRRWLHRPLRDRGVVGQRHHAVSTLIDSGREADPVSGTGQALRETFRALGDVRSEEHTSELQSLMRISYAVFCLEK